MPRGDRTGPLGMGAQSGRTAGYCGGFGAPGFMNPALGRGSGMGFGRGRGAWGWGAGGGGRGWRNMFFATGLPGWMRLGGSPTPHGYPPSHLKPDSAVEEKALRSQAAALQSELDSIKKRLGEIETEPAPE